MMLGGATKGVGTPQASINLVGFQLARDDSVSKLVSIHRMRSHYLLFRGTSVEVAILRISSDAKRGIIGSARTGCLVTVVDLIGGRR